MKHDIQNRNDLELLVRTFYDKVRADTELGPIFNGLITDWESHLQNYQFLGTTYVWCSKI